MTEQEKRRRRREMERRMRTRSGGRKKERKRGGLFLFRAYVTMVLVGGCLLISQFHTETSEMVCEKIKTIISMEISAKEMAIWKEKVAAYFEEKEFSLPVLEIAEPKEEKKVYRPDTAP